MGISSRNSEVIHAGIYYPHGSLKANLCIEGRELIYDTCKKENIPHKRLGKLIIAMSADEISVIEDLFLNATGNGIKSLSILDQKHISQIEPDIRAVSAIFSLTRESSASLPDGLSISGTLKIMAQKLYMEQRSKESPRFRMGTRSPHLIRQANCLNLLRKKSLTLPDCSLILLPK